MTTYFISRHSGAIDWAKQQGIEVDEQPRHFDAEQTRPGDTIIGTLPVNLIAKVCELGGRYLHLSLDLPADARGKELTPEEMTKYNARLEEYKAERL